MTQPKQHFFVKKMLKNQARKLHNLPVQKTKSYERKQKKHTANVRPINDWMKAVFPAFLGPTT